MGAFVVFLPGGEAAPASRGRDRAEAVIAAKRLVPAGTVAEGVKFRRLDGSGSAPAASERGWVLSAGSWFHPGLGIDDNRALLRRLEGGGDGILDELDGSYVVMWWQAGSGTLTVALDPLARLHTFYAESSEGVYVSTSAVAVAAAVGAEPDPVGVWEFLACGTLYEDRTPFERVKRMTAARRYRFRRGRLVSSGLVEQQLLPPPGAPDAAAGLDDLVATHREALRAVPSGARPLVDLTGGRDSRLVAGLFFEADIPFDVTVTGERGDPEVEVARELANRLGLEIRVRSRAAMAEAQGSFDRVLRAAAHVDGEYDAVAYAGIAAVQEPHVGEYGLSVNGSGGELLRDFSYSVWRQGRGGGDPVERLLPRFAGSAMSPPVLAAAHLLDAEEHFRAVLRRELRLRDGDPLVSVYDHAYLHLRMQCWQGAISSATNEIWPNLSPLLFRGCLETLYRVPSQRRVRAALYRDLLARLPAPFTDVPLASGLPPRRLRVSDLWRLLGLAADMPARLLRKSRERRLRHQADPRQAHIVRRLCSRGALDFLEADQMALRPLIDRDRLCRFRDAAADRGDVSLAALGRLIGLEHALRAASGRQAADFDSSAADRADRNGGDACP